MGDRYDESDERAQRGGAAKDRIQRRHRRTTAETWRCSALTAPIAGHLQPKGADAGHRTENEGGAHKARRLEGKTRHQSGRMIEPQASRYSLSNRRIAIIHSLATLRRTAHSSRMLTIQPAALRNARSREQGRTGHVITSYVPTTIINSSVKKGVCKKNLLLADADRPIFHRRRPYLNS